MPAVTSSSPAATRGAARTTTAATRAASAELDYRPSYLAAAASSAVVFVLYLLTLAPNTAMWDTSEYIASAYVLGQPHPPGNPLFVMLGRIFSLLPIHPSIAGRINILAALASAVSAGFWFLIAERVLVAWFPERWQRITGGALATLIGATAFTVWNQSVVNEKVYTISLVGMAVISWLAVKWADDPEGWRADRLLVLMAYLLGLGYTNHMAGMIAAPAIAVAVLVRRPQTILRWKLLLAIVGALLLGLTPFAFEPIRAAHFPAINEGETTGCATKIEWDCTFSHLTYTRLKDNLNRTQYGKPEVSQRQATFGQQIGMWWLYFKWQWVRDQHGHHPVAQPVLAVVFLVLGLLGGYVHWRRDPRSFWFFGPLIFILTIGLILYLNFKCGYTQAKLPGSTCTDSEVRDRDYFFLWSFSAWGVWAALGLAAIWESVAALLGTDAVKLGRETIAVPRRRSWLMASPVLALALVPLLANWRAASRAGETFTRDFAVDLLNSVEPYGILITGGDNDTFPLWYAQEVEGVRKDVTVAVSSYLRTDWYVRQLMRRPVYEYDAAQGPAAYRGRQWPKPTRPMLAMTMAEADAIPEFQATDSGPVFQKDQLVAKIHPHAFREQTASGRDTTAYALFRDELVVLHLIKDAFPERPIYFSGGAGGYGDDLGLTPYLITQGLARRLVPTIPAPGRDTALIAGAGFLDVPRTLALWNGFGAPSAIIKRNDWVDRASISIPYLYISTGALLAEGLTHAGDSVTAKKVYDRAEAVAKAARLDDVLKGQ